MNCSNPEPWGRYSASGGIYNFNEKDYFYAFGGDTTSNSDNRGGVVSTHFRFNGNCWERLQNSPVPIGYRASAIQLSEDSVYIVGGADANRNAVKTLWKYRLEDDTWEQLADIPTARWKPAAVALDETRFLVTGGRDGSTVHNDAWVYDAASDSWTKLDIVLPPMYRHGLVHRDGILYFSGGLDDTLTRYRGQLWRVNLTDLSIETLETSLPRMASHTMEWVTPETILLWSGTCADNAQIYLLDIATQSICQVAPLQTPDRRDAQLWSYQHPILTIATGDSICYNRQILSLADVHQLDLSQPNLSWTMLYEPTNIGRGTGNEPFCDGTNAGACQPNPLLLSNSAMTTCSQDILARFRETATPQDEGSRLPTDLPIAMITEPPTQAISVEMPSLQPVSMTLPPMASIPTASSSSSSMHVILMLLVCLLLR